MFFLPQKRSRLTLVPIAVSLLFCVIADGRSSAAVFGFSSQDRTDLAAKANESYAAGVAALKQQDLATAREKFEEAARLAPESAEAHNSLGYVLLLSGDTEAAIRELRSATRLKPTFAQARTTLADALLQKGSVADAILEARRAIKLAPRNSDAYRALGRSLNAAHDLDGAVAAISKGVELNPDSAELRDDFGVLLVNQRKSKEAAEQFQAAINI